MDWLEMDQVMVQWWALVNTVMNLRVNKRRGISRPAGDYQLLKVGVDAKSEWT
jgi:hypothetical protein